MTETAPEVVTRYLRAADTKDAKACAACFTKTGTVLDEGVTYRGRHDIRSWRETTLGKWTYTTEVTGSTPVTPHEHQVTVHVAGDFPGGQADLTYSFTLQDDLIAALKIVE